MTSQSPQGPAPYGLRGPGGNRTCIAMYSTPAVEYVFKPRRRVRQRHSCVSTVPPQPLGAGGSRTRTTCVTGFDVLQQAVGDVLFSKDRRGCWSETFRCSPVELRRYGTFPELRRWDSNPQQPGYEPCTPTWQSVCIGWATKWRSERISVRESNPPPGCLPGPRLTGLSRCTPTFSRPVCSAQRSCYRDVSRRWCDVVPAGSWASLLEGVQRGLVRTFSSNQDVV